MTEKKFTAGQSVVIMRGYGWNREPQHHEVSKVGRTLVYVKVNSWLEQAFYIANGAERRGPNAGGIGDHLYTVEEWADRQRRDEITKALAEHGIGPKGYGHFSQSTATLEQILTVLQATVHTDSDMGGSR